MTNSKKNELTERSDSDKIKTNHLFYPSSLISIVVFLLTFYPYYKSDIVLITFLPFYSSYVFSYLILLLVIYFITVISFKNKSIGLAIFAPHVLVYGYHPLEFSSRLGIKYIDIAGAIISFIFCIISLIILPIKMFFPGFLLFFISFLASFFWSSQKKWEFKRRGL